LHGLTEVVVTMPGRADVFAVLLRGRFVET